MRQWILSLPKRLRYFPQREPGAVNAVLRICLRIVETTLREHSPGVPDLVGNRRRCFIGSLNLDPRALEINTENGLCIESPELAAELAASFDVMMQPENAWRVYLDEEQQSLSWQSDRGTVNTQPARGFGQRVADFFFRLLPIESQL